MASKFSDWSALGDEDESRKPKLKRDKNGIMRQVGLRYEFDCPECDANNPYDDGFTDGAELRCNYCGQDFKVQVLDEKRLKFKAI
jgi:transcription elongation factor Elf1